MDGRGFDNVTYICQNMRNQILNICKNQENYLCIIIFAWLKPIILFTLAREIN